MRRGGYECRQPCSETQKTYIYIHIYNQINNVIYYIYIYIYICNVDTNSSVE